MPVIFHAIGIAEFKNELQEKKYIKLFKKNNIVGISCRFNEERFNNTFQTKKATFTFDPGIFASELFDVKKNSRSNCIGLGVMMSSRYKEQIIIEFWIDIIEKLNEQQIKWKIFTTGQTSDYLLAKKILMRLKYSNDVVKEKLANNPRTINELVETISEFDRILSFRLHSHIIAYSLNVPSVAIEWDRKIKDFMNSIDNINSYLTISSSANAVLDLLFSISTSIDYERKIMENKQILRKNLYSLIDTIV